MAVSLHPLPFCVEKVNAPKQFTYPFCYEPHPLCVAAADEVRRYIRRHAEWHDELQRGKMFGVLIVKTLNGMGFLAAFSGTLDGKTQHEYFVPPVFDLMAPGCYFQREEAAISAINRRILLLESTMQPSPLRKQMDEELAAYREFMQQSKAERDAKRQNSSSDEEDGVGLLIRESQHQKAEYRRLKQAWEQRIFDDEAGVMNLSVEDIKGDVMIVSQFTLHAMTKKGNRPSWIKAAPEAISKPLYEEFVAKVEAALGRRVATGSFGADMKIELTNDGPVTIWIDSKNRE